MEDTHRPASVADTVERLRRRLADGRIDPGERLIEERLAADLGVSRTPIREALITLSAQGFVRRTRRGWQAPSFSRAELNDAFELRAMLEALAARQAAQRATDEDRAHIEAAYREAHETVSDSMRREDLDPQLVGEANSRFHRAVMDASHNRVLVAAAESVLSLPLVFNAPVYDTPEDSLRFDHLHRWITEAILAGEAERAERLMLEHILHARDLVLRRLDSGAETLLPVDGKTTPVVQLLAES
jgi:DNA-binding GntR family transcriptional regulator